MPELEEHRLRPLVREDLDRVLAWRNSEAVRRFMYRDHVISPGEHLDWFDRLQDSNDRETSVFELAGRPMGVVNLSSIDREKREAEWGFYLGEQDRPRGCGLVLGWLALERAFGELNLLKLTGVILDFNTASIGFHERLGFHRRGTLTNQVHKEGVARDVILMELARKDWLALRDQLREHALEKIRHGR